MNKKKNVENSVKHDTYNVNQSVVFFLYSHSIQLINYYYYYVNTTVENFRLRHD